MIRDATEADIPALLDMGERFAEKARTAEHIGYDRESVGITLAHLIGSPDGIVLITDARDGAIGGLCHPHPFNLKVKVGQELFWWSEGPHGLALLDALEARARALGAALWTMIALETIRPEATGKLYQRREYRPLERSFIKEL